MTVCIACKFLIGAATNSWNNKLASLLCELMLLESSIALIIIFNFILLSVLFFNSFWKNLIFSVNEVLDKSLRLSFLLNNSACILLWKSFTNLISLVKTFSLLDLLKIFSVYLLLGPASSNSLFSSKMSKFT